MMLDALAALGWVHAIAVAACFISVVMTFFGLAQKALSNRQERLLKEMDQRHEMTQEVNRYDE